MDELGTSHDRHAVAALTDVAGDDAISTTRAIAVRGVRWTAAGRGLAELTALAALIVTSRLLTPAEVGHAAVGLVVVAVAIGLSQQGFGSPVVRKPELAAPDLPTAHLLSLGFGAVAAAATLVLAAALDGSLGEEMADAMRWAVLAFPLAALGTVPMAAIQRRLDFRTLAIIDAIGSLAGAVATIVLAAAGVGAVSLIAGPLVFVGIVSVGCLVAVPAVWGRPAAAAADELFRFGLPTAGAGILHLAARNIDYAILAARLPAAQVGLYMRAFQLGAEYQGKVSGILVRMALPLFSRAESPEQLRAIRTRMARLHAVVLFPALLLLVVLAPSLVPGLFGEAWVDAVTPTQVLAVVGMVSVVGTGTGPLLTAAGHPRALLAFTAVDLTLYAGAVFLLVDNGIVAVSVGILVERVAVLVLLQVMVQRLVGISLRASLGTDLLPALLASVPATLLALGCSGLLRSVDAPDLAVVAVAGALAGGLYVVTLRLRFPDAWADLRSLLPDRAAQPETGTDPAIPSPSP